ncbi:MAG: hypothetical protein ABWY55_05030 [Microbacterium sp.]
MTQTALGTLAPTSDALGDALAQDTLVLRRAWRWTTRVVRSSTFKVTAALALAVLGLFAAHLADVDLQQRLVAEQRHHDQLSAEVHTQQRAGAQTAIKAVEAAERLAQQRALLASTDGFLK